MSCYLLTDIYLQQHWNTIRATSGAELKLATELWHDNVVADGVNTDEHLSNHWAETEWMW